MTVAGPRHTVLSAAPWSAAVGLPLAWLGEGERARAAAYAGPGHDGDVPALHGGAVLREADSPRGRFLAGRLLLRQLAADAWALGAPGRLHVHQWCPACGSGAHGGPRLHRDSPRVALDLSYSRCAGWFLLAGRPHAAGGPVRLGVDLADAADPGFAGDVGSALDEVVLSAGERELLGRVPPHERAGQRARWWAAKEALGKALGAGITGGAAPPVVAGAGSDPALEAAGALVDWPALPADVPATLTAALVLLPASAAAPAGTTTG